MNFGDEFWGGSDRDVETRSCNSSNDNYWSVRPSDEKDWYIIVNMDKTQQALIDANDKNVQIREGFSLSDRRYKWQFVSESDLGSRFFQIKSKRNLCISIRKQTGDAHFYYDRCDPEDESQFFQMMNPDSDKLSPPANKVYKK